MSISEQSIRNVMLNSWDPAGEAHNENFYHTYDWAIPIIRFYLSNKATKEELTEALMSLEKGMGLPGDDESIPQAAESLLRLKD